MAQQEVGNSLSFPPLSLKHCFIRGRVLPLLPQASRESVLQAHGAGAAEGAGADLVPQRDARHSTSAGWRSTQRRPWTCARPSPPRSLGASRANGNGVCSITSRQRNKLCICLIDATHRLSRARSKLLQWITKLPWLQGSCFDLHHQHFTAADSHMRKYNISGLYNEVIWRRARVIYLFVPTSLRFTTLYKYKLGNLLSIFSRNALCRKQLSATGSCAPQSSSFRQREAS